MSDPATIRVDVLAGLFGQVREIIGEDSTCSMLHYAAAEEGRILGAQAEGIDDLRQALARVEIHLGSKLELLKEGPEMIDIRVPGFKDRLTDRPLQAVVLGLLEGLLLSARHRPYEGTINGGASDGIVHLAPAKAQPGGAG